MLSLLLPLALSSSLAATPSFVQREDITPHTFRYVSDTPLTSVNLAGDFNNWDKSASPMKALAGNKIFQLTVPLTYGRHEYKFVLNGETWVTDPNGTTRDDGNGNKNSYIFISPPDYDQPARVGDGKIATSALRHVPAIPDLNYDLGKLQIGFRTRPNDVQSVSLLVSGQKPISLTEKASDGVFAHYGAELDWNRKKDLEYVFKVTDGPTTLYYGPHGATAGADGNRFKLEAKTFKPFVVPNWVQHSVIYQIFPDRFANGDKSNDGPDVQPWGAPPSFSNRFGGDIAGVRQHEKYLSDLGISCIYFNPIFESPVNHGYETTDYLKIDHRFGSNQEFDQMVQELNHLGIRTVLDGVFNHTARSFFAFDDVVKKGAASSYVPWYFFHGFPVSAPNQPPNYTGWFGYASLPKLNYGTPAVKQYMLDIPRYWAKQASLGGWRLDAANEVVDDYWRLFRQDVKSLDPNMWICGEIWGDASHWLQGDMFDSTMNYRFRDAVLGFLSPTGDHKPSTLWNSLMSTYLLYPPQVDRNLMNLVDSHDTERLLTEVGHDRKLADLAAVLQFTWVGTPSVYYGDEVGLDGGKDPDDRRCMPWEIAHNDNPTLQLYKSLIGLRNRSAVLQMGQPIKLLADDAKGVLVFARVYEGHSVLVAVNGSSTPQTVEVSSSIPALKGTKFVLATNGKTTIYPPLGGPRPMRIDVPAKGFQILRS